MKTMREALRLDSRRSLGDLVETRYIDEKSALLAFTKACDPAVNSECWIESPIGARRYWKRTVALVAMLFVMMFGGLAQAQTSFTQTQTVPTVTNAAGLQAAQDTSVATFHTVTSGKLRAWVADIVVANQDSVCTLLSNGDGTFQQPACFAAVAGLSGVAIADTNQDGYPDILALDPTGVTVFYGDNTGVFSSVKSEHIAAVQPAPQVILAAVEPITVGTAQQLAILSKTGLNIGRFQTNILNPNAMVVDAFATNGLQDVAVLSQNGLSIFHQTISTATSTTVFHAQSISTSPSPSLSVTASRGGSTAAAIQITNSEFINLSPFNVLIGGGNGDWGLGLNNGGCPNVLTGNGSCTATVFFSPTTVEIGSNSTLNIVGVDTNGVTSTQSVNLIGIEQPFASANISPSTVSFGPQLTNTTSGQQIVTLTNTGNESITPTIFAPAPFTQTNNCPSSLPWQSACSIFISFAPTTTGVQSGNATVSFLETTTQNIGLSGSSVAAPSIVAQPTPQTVFFSQPVTFSLFASGTTPLSYVWTKSGSPIGTNSSTLTFIPTATDNGALIQAIVVNPYGTVTSSAVPLTVILTPRITAGLSNQSVLLGSTATFSVTATGAGTLSYAWTKAGIAVGTNSPTYTTAPTIASDNGAAVSVVVSSAYGTVTSSATLSINFPPTVTTPVANQTVIAGNAANFSVVVSGTSPITYVWSLAGSVIGGNLSTLSFPTTAAENGDQVSVTATNAYGSVTSTGVLTVLTVPAITTQPASTSVTLGQTATFNVVATGSAPLHYAWTLGGIAAGTDSPTFTTPATTTVSNGAIIKVVVTNSAGSVMSANAILSINFPATITIQPTPLTEIVGHLATFSVTATGTNNTYQWLANSQPIAGATSSSYSVVSETSGILYSCVVSNPYGPSVTSSTALLTVQFPPTIAITKTPTADLIPGQAATLTATVTAGTTPITFLWYLTNGNVPIAGATSSSYTTPALTAFEYQYTVVATNMAGQTTANFNVIVDQPPTISSSSGNQSTNTNSAAATVTFWVVATSEPITPLTYQWFRAGVSVLGATSARYTTPPVSTGDNGVAFTCVVSNAAGSITSAPMILTALGASPSMTVSLGPSTTGGGTVTTGSTASYIAGAQFINGGNATINFSNCIVPVGFACSISSPSVSAQNSGTNTSQGSTILLITTPTTASTPPQIPTPTAPVPPTTEYIVGLLLALGVAFATRPQYRRKLVPVLASCVILVMLSGCGGGSVSVAPTGVVPTPTNPVPPTTVPTPAPPSNTYTVSVTVGSLVMASPSNPTGSSVVSASLVVTH